MVSVVCSSRGRLKKGNSKGQVEKPNTEMMMGIKKNFEVVGEGAFSYCLQTTKDTIIEKTMSDLTANL